MKNKDAIKWIKAIKEKYIHGGDESFDEYRKESLDMAIKALEAQGWIPIKTREMSAEEVKEVNEKYDFDLDGDEAWCICSPLPEDAQEVLITTKYGDVVLTEFCVDEDGCCFDGYEDRDDVLAWMPLPKPYTKEDSENERD